LQNFVEVFTFDISHGDESGPLGFAQVVNAQNIFVGNLAGEQQFLTETLGNGGIGSQRRADKLESDHAVQVTVIGAVNCPHATFAQQAFHFIARKSTSGLAWPVELSGPDGGGVSVAVARVADSASVASAWVPNAAANFGGGGLAGDAESNAPHAPQRDEPSTFCAEQD
jgi:hypothetical protein